ncbi:MAG: response regulator [Alphaproteobacteria bacterium]|nr:response regulator [Alphaproteobacteria bacterium]MCW5738573.1 response regulator [Alphaproteobacteria bacterium]
MRAAIARILAAPEAGPPDIDAADGSPVARNGKASAPAVLVVEDEVIIRLVAADVLRECGYRVLEAKTGEEAQAIMGAGEQVDVLFTDIDLGPGISGMELASWVRENHPSVRIILTSGVGRMTDVAHLCDAPPMPKPYDYGELIRQVKSLMSAAESI